MTITVSTYNIHACVGMDGHFKPERIIAVLREVNADVMALQEVEHHAVEGYDLLDYLAAKTGLTAIAGPILPRASRHYGNAFNKVIHLDVGPDRSECAGSRTAGRTRRRPQLQQAMSYSIHKCSPSKIRHIIMDGDRIRLKAKKRGQKTAKERSRYRGAWREPKLFILYVVEADGKIARGFMPIMNAIIRGPDALFKWLRSYLGQLGITEADQVLFVADGARWIWNRISALVHDLGLNPEQVYELIEFYHAVEHLGKVAGLRKSWAARQRKVWVRKPRRLLKQGQADKVIEAVKEVCR